MLTAAELKMSQEELDALLKVREMLANGQIEHRDTYAGKLPACGLDMSVPQEKHRCGTAMCIGGWVKTFMLGVKPDAKGVYHLTDREGHEVAKYVHRHCDDPDDEGYVPLCTLYYPQDTGWDWEDLKPIHGIQAIDNFLATGDADWASVVE
jgi:hypothetical protein